MAMNVGMPQVSVVIPLYQKADVIAETLRAVLGQTFADFELVVVDDGSRDGGGAIVEAIADPRIRLIRQANQGEAAARNRGVREARADWIAFLDADDLWTDTHLEDLVAAAAAGDAILVFSNYVLSSAARPVIPAAVPSQRVDDFFKFALTVYGYPVHPSAVMIRRAALVTAGLFPVGVQMGGDTDTWCRLALHGAFRYVARPTAVYRDGHPTSVLASQLQRAPLPPSFERTLADLAHHQKLPRRLASTAHRYKNFLMLEYARQLLDRGDSVAARRVLLRQCRIHQDPVRYLKRLLRTWSVGHNLYTMIRPAAAAR
ncbi:Undecaprenyl-phosphate 4-deoxy-4-formamido-L-arabinose transferase [Methylobacterium crusticola]|uniref:Undecaprenyl-phosphate 4-deoxy-4-formamido-L-arabinose transferase n=1 Tax=Methylobacterium crusticola TaxID=1697972 RepID=A0ABQ4R644_9HYPH|nr:glycosyltransferase family 2 protein [Methylobacterium crusticola]GJD53118.1 Undecaprenyl-phosphate 4-deoxy-4-formamido-L-arabinose transferase [Methylobacterium crusticola]